MYTMLCLPIHLFMDTFCLLAIVNNAAMSLAYKYLEFFFQSFWVYTQEWNCWVRLKFFV